jgi:hypothetical protein
MRVLRAMWSSFPHILFHERGNCSPTQRGCLHQIGPTVKKFTIINFEHGLLQVLIGFMKPSTIKMEKALPESDQSELKYLGPCQLVDG